VADIDLVTAFRSTVLRIRTAGDWVQLTPTTSRAGGVLGEPVLHVFSAWYPPVGRDVDPLFNVRRHQELADELQGLGERVAPAVGVSPDLAYGEWSWAAWGLRREDAVTLAARYLQLALFEVTEDEIVLVSCDDAIPTLVSPYRLDRFATLPCVMQGLAAALPVPDPANGGQPAGPCDAAVTASDKANAHHPEVLEWQRRYGLLGCDLCGGRA
jgi:hypothetical protein